MAVNKKASEMLPVYEAIEAASNKDESIGNVLAEKVKFAYNLDQLYIKHKYGALPKSFRAKPKKRRSTPGETTQSIFWDFNAKTFVGESSYGDTIWVIDVNVREFRDERWLSGMLADSMELLIEAAIDAVSRRIARRAKKLIELHEFGERRWYYSVRRSDDFGYMLLGELSPDTVARHFPEQFEMLAYECEYNIAHSQWEIVRSQWEKVKDDPNFQAAVAKIKEEAKSAKLRFISNFEV